MQFLKPTKIPYETHKFCYIYCGVFYSGRSADLFDTTNPDWVPSIKMGYEEKACKVEIAVARNKRAKARENKRKDLEAAETILSLTNLIPAENEGQYIDYIPINFIRFENSLT